MGYPHPDYLLSILTSEQLSEWMAFYNLEPFGFEMERNKFGMLTSTVANVFASKKSGDSFTVNDFYPRPEDIMFKKDKKLKKQDVEEMKEILMQLAGKEKG